MRSKPNIDIGMWSKEMFLINHIIHKRGRKQQQVSNLGQSNKGSYWNTIRRPIALRMQSLSQNLRQELSIQHLIQISQLTFRQSL